MPRRRQARKSDRSDLRAAARNDVANAIGLELLREGSLLLNVLPLAVPERLIHFLGATGADDFEPGKINACLVPAIFEHRQWLAPAEENDLRPFEPLPIKVRIG